MSDDPKHSLSRRELAKALLGGAGAAGMVACSDPEAVVEDDPPQFIPPPNARYQTTACAYCVVGCGYRVYSWPTSDRAGGRAAEDNGLDADLPVGIGGPWLSPEMVNTVTIVQTGTNNVAPPDLATGGAAAATVIQKKVNV